VLLEGETMENEQDIKEEMHKREYPDSIEIQKKDKEGNTVKIKLYSDFSDKKLTEEKLNRMAEIKKTFMI